MREAAPSTADSLARIADALERIADASETPRRKPRNRAGIERARAQVIKAATVSPLDRAAARKALSRLGRRLP